MLVVIIYIRVIGDVGKVATLWLQETPGVCQWVKKLCLNNVDEHLSSADAFLVQAWAQHLELDREQRMKLRATNEIKVRLEQNSDYTACCHVIW